MPYGYAFSSLVSYSSSKSLRRDSDVQDICRIIIPIFVFSTQLGFYRQSAAIDSLVDQFSEVLDNLNLSDCWDRYPGLMIWAFMFAVFSSREQTQREWFLFEMSKGGQNKTLWHWQDIRKTILGFFYIERLHEVEFEKICKEVRLLDGFATHLIP